MEIWKEIEGYEGSYEVSSYGRVRSMDRTIIRSDGIKHLRKGILLSLTENKGYFYAKLSGKRISVHRLVGNAFVLKEIGRDYINHIDGNKRNNISTNLEWVTHSENISHAYKSGLLISLKGGKNPGSKINEEDVISIRNRYKNNEKVSTLAKEYKITPTSVRRILNRETWKHI